MHGMQLKAGAVHVDFGTYGMQLKAGMLASQRRPRLPKVNCVDPPLVTCISGGIMQDLH